MGSGPFMPEAQVTVFNKLGLLHFIARFFCRWVHVFDLKKDKTFTLTFPFPSNTKCHWREIVSNDFPWPFNTIPEIHNLFKWLCLESHDVLYKSCCSCQWWNYLDRLLIYWFVSVFMPRFPFLVPRGAWTLEFSWSNLSGESMVVLFKVWLFLHNNLVTL